jgi:hypothetical protein
MRMKTEEVKYLDGDEDLEGEYTQMRIKTEKRMRLS